MLIESIDIAPNWHVLDGCRRPFPLASVVPDCVIAVNAIAVLRPSSQVELRDGVVVSGYLLGFVHHAFIVDEYCAPIGE